MSEEQGQLRQQELHQQQAGPQRQVVVRRFQIVFQIDLFLILKLAAVIFLFNQDGSRQRLVLLVFFAVLIYLYQTGALVPLIRWLSQGMQRAAAPPQPPRPAVGPDNVLEAEGKGMRMLLWQGGNLELRMRIRLRMPDIWRLEMSKNLGRAIMAIAGGELLN